MDLSDVEKEATHDWLAFRDAQDEIWDAWDNEEPFTDGPLKHQYAKIQGWSGIAFFIDADDGMNTVQCHMVGDDRNFTIDRDDVTVITDDEFCSGCGGTSCYWGH